MAFNNKYSIWDQCPKCTGYLEVFAKALICEECGEVYPDYDYEETEDDRSDEKYENWKDQQQLNN